MSWKLDPKSSAIGLAVGAAAMLVLGAPWKQIPAIGQPAAGAQGQRYELRTWATANQYSREHGAYVIDTYTGDVRSISETGNVQTFVYKDKP